MIDAYWFLGIHQQIKLYFAKTTKCEVFQYHWSSEIRNQQSEFCLFNPFTNYIEYYLIYIYKHMGQRDIS